jgi:hypothetical protein
MTNLLILTDSVIAALATNPTIVANFGECFGNLRPSRDCGRPCGKQARLRADDYAVVKGCIAGLAPKRMLLLKRLLDARQVRVKFRRGASDVVLTF